VRKKDGSHHVCVDFRDVNDLTRKDAYALPRIDVCLDALSGSLWFSTLDLRSGYHQIAMEPEDKCKTAFICTSGMFSYNFMPFGLCNAGATFQRLIDLVMTGLSYDICLCYFYFYEFIRTQSTTVGNDISIV